MFNKEKVLYKGNTGLASYQVVDMVYEGRKARVLFSGEREAAFSGMPLDGGHDLLFDYIQRLFELVAYTRPGRLLIIGGGTYTLPTALSAALPDINIDVVEIDPGMDKLAVQFFGFLPDPRLRIFHMEGKEYLKKINRSYDMIIIDAFTNLQIPESLSGEAMALLTKKRLTGKGMLAMNIISAYYGRASPTIKSYDEIYNNIYKKTYIYPTDASISLWSSQNFILIAEKGAARQTHGLRAGPLDISTPA